MEQPQVTRNHYDFERYGFEGRFVSYYWQIHEVLKNSPSSILEVGVGDGVFRSFIENNTDIKYQSLDIASDLAPDKVGSVTNIPCVDKSFDVACAFEVLEHLPFEQFEMSISELCRVARKYVVISLPHFGPMLSFSCKIPFLPQVRWAWKIPFSKRHIFNGEHYWEIGKRGYPISRIRKVLAEHGRITSDFVPFYSDYHHFFVIDVRKVNKL